MKQSTQTKLNESIERLGGEAAVGPSRAAATAAEREREGAACHQPPPLTLDIGYFVWLGSSLIDPAARKSGVVIDACGEDSVVVARDRMRQHRQETWFEVWPIADIDFEVDVPQPLGSAKRAQAAKKLLLSIGETIKAGGWSEEDERRFAAAAVLTAELARPWRSAA